MITPAISTDPFVFICHLQSQDGKLRIIENPKLKRFYIEKWNDKYWESKKDFDSLPEAKEYYFENFIFLKI